MKTDLLKSAKLLAVSFVLFVTALSLVFIGCLPSIPAGGGQPTTGGTPDKAPGAPTGLAITPGDGEITLKWEAPTDTGTINGDGTTGTITSYTVYYSTTQGFATGNAGVVKKVVRSSVLTTTITSLTNRAMYYFKVTASNAIGEGSAAEANGAPESDEARAEAPTNLVFGTYTYDSTAKTSGLTLSWTAPSFTGLQDGTATPLSGFKVYYSTTQGFDLNSGIPISISNADATSQVISGLDSGTEYFFKVTASNTNANGEGEGTASAEAGTFTNGPPGTPSDIVFANFKGTSLDISWTAAHPGYKDGSEAAISQYTLYYHTTEGFNITTAGVQSTTTSGATVTATISGLTNGVDYYFKVSATNEFGEGGVSEERLLANNAPPSAPHDLSFSAYSKTGVTVSWEAPSDTGFENGLEGTLSSYKVYYSTTSGFDITSGSVMSIATSNASTLSRAITGLTAGTQYYFKVTASNASGESTPSVEASTYTDGTPDAPVNLGMSGHSETGVIVSWNAAGTGYKNGIPAVLTGFEVYYSKTQGFDITSVAPITISNPDTTSQAISGLTAGTRYYFKATAFNAIGGSMASAEASTYTDGIPDAPENLGTSDHSETGFTISWNAAGTGYRNGFPAALSGFKVYYSKTQGFNLASVTPITISNANTTSKAISGLTAGTRYYVKVTAFNAIGESAPSAEEGTRTKGIMYSTVFRNVPGGVDGLKAAQSVVVSADGKNVYVVGYADDSLAVFTRDTTTGDLTYSTVFKDGTGGVDGLDGAMSVAVSEDGKNVYVTGYLDNALAVFTRDTTTGDLTYSTVFRNVSGGVDGLNGALYAAVSRDGKNVYVTGYLDNSLAVFTRDTITGALTYSTVFKNVPGGVDGLYGAYSVAVSQDGKNIYVTGLEDNALAVFTRNTSTGALTYSTVFRNVPGGVDGLYNASSVAVSQDGKNVYVAGYNDDALAVFTRDTTTGALTYSTVFKDGTGGVDGLDGIRSVAVSENGKTVYVTGYWDDALAVFTRDTTTGVLTYSTVFKDGIGGVDGLDGAWAVAVSRDGKTAYVSGYFDNALAVFTLE